MPTAGNDGKGRKATPSRLPKAERKLIIIEQARKLFAAHGYSHTSLESIADASGMIPSVLGKTFASKQALFTAVLQSWPGWIVQPVGSTGPVHLVPDLVAVLTGFADRFLQAARQNADLFNLLTHALLTPEEPEEQQAAQSCLHHAMKPLIELLQAGQQAGIFRRVPDTRMAAEDCLRFLLGSALFPIARVKKNDESGIAVLETLLHGILKMDV
jgi:AcrR family transcriptional regulator